MAQFFNLFENLFAAAPMKMVGQDGYLDMLHDNDRNSKYFAAIRSAIATRHKNKQKAIVLDIGTGCGLLAMMAASAGADEVYACEELLLMANCARNVFATNNFLNIRLIAKNSKHMTIGHRGDMPEKANILVTEIFGNEFLAEEAIETINHANRYLLTDDCIHIPQRAVLYAQVVDCSLTNKMNTIENISLPNGTEIRFPDSIKTCSNKTNLTLEMQLETLPADNFLRISNSLAVFEFHWNAIVAEERANSIEFISCRNGNANTIFSWWDLYMDESDENVISIKPTWAGGSIDNNWRYGWMPRIYTGFCTSNLDVQEGTKCMLSAFHNKTDVWYKVCKASAYRPQDAIIEPFSNACSCYLHKLFNSHQIGEANSVDKIAKYVTILREHIIPGKSTVLVLSEPDGTILHLLAAGLGAKKVFLIPTHTDEPHVYRLIIQMLITFNNFQNIIELLPATIDGDLLADDFKNVNIDLVVGDPYFGRQSCQDESFVRPFHHLLLWKHVNFLKHDLHVVNVNCPISPATAIIKAIAIKFDHPLARINCPIDSVCDDQFNISDFANLMRLPDEKMMDYQYLWQYPGTAASDTVPILDFDFSDTEPNNGRKSNSGILHLQQPADGFVVWIEWKTGDQTISTGPSETPILGERVIWEVYKKQGVYYNYNVWNEVIHWSIEYEYRSNKLVFIAR